MKKLFCLIISIILTLGFTACKNSGIASETESSSQSETGEQAGYSVIRTDVKNGDKNIYGNLYMPSVKKDKYSLVIMSHSAFLTGSSLKAYAAGFAERGYMAYAFDFCGGSPFSRSDGDSGAMTIFTEVADLEAVIDYFRLRPETDIDEIYLLGTSQGGLVSALTAEAESDKIAGMILMYPAFNIPEQVGGNSGVGGAILGKEYVETIKDFDVYSNIGKFEKPVLIIHGTKDTTVDLSYSVRAAEKYADCTLKTIENAPHGFNGDNFSLFGNYDSFVWQYIDEFLNLYKTAGNKTV